MKNKAALQHIRQYYNSLSPMSEVVWLIFSRNLHVRQLAQGEMLLAEGQICNFVAFIHEGLLRVYHNRDGNERILYFPSEGDYISGFPSFITGEPALYAIEAIEPTTVVLLYRQDMDKLYKNYPYSNKWGRMVEEGVFSKVIQRLLTLHTLSAEEQYLDLLASKPHLIQRIPQYMIASYIGITPEALSRIRRRLSQPRGSAGPTA